MALPIEAWAFQTTNVGKHLILQGVPSKAQFFDFHVYDMYIIYVCPTTFSRHGLCRTFEHEKGSESIDTLRCSSPKFT